MARPAVSRKAPSRYWLFKSEPTTYSIDDFRVAKRDMWDGIRNYQARNLMRDEIAVGDEFYFYHSSCAMPAVVGVGKVIKPVFTDPTQFDPQERYYDPKSDPAKPRWLCLEVGFVAKARTPLTLATMRTEPRLAELPLLLRGNRLSIQPVAAAHWRFFRKLIG